MRERAQRFDPRQNMKASDFEVFHYLDTHPAPISIHHHDFYEVYLFLSGHVEYRVEGRICRPAPGDLLLISPLELHQPIVQTVQEPYERIVLWLSREYLAELSDEDTDLTRCFDNTLPTHTNLLRLPPALRTSVSARMKELVHEVYGGEYGGRLCAKGVLLQLMTELNRIVLYTAVQDGLQVEPSALITQVLAYIGAHFCEELSLDRLADRFFVSKFHLEHAFRQTVGTGVYRYILLKRLLTAKQLLEDDQPPGEVSRRCGFGSYVNFYRAFKSEYGISPGEYRKK